MASDTPVVILTVQFVSKVRNNQLGEGLMLEAYSLTMIQLAHEQELMTGKE
jgi:hypothetical protein